MAHFEQKRIGEFTIRIDRLLCVGFGDCVKASPEAFELDGEGIAVLRPGASAVEDTELVAACRSCPVDAIELRDSEGKQIVP